MKSILRSAAALIACLMLMNCLAAAEIAADIPVSETCDDGRIRVRLDSLGSPEAMYITLTADYNASGDVDLRLMSGTELAVAADDGNIVIYAGGVVLSAGSALSLTRCSDGGMYIYESEKDALYMGDLLITCDDGRLTPVLTIGMEDYLCGVVAYEMSDSFPLEALKAQAVAARTYAMSKKAVRADKDYDVTDTTTDQVFKGYVGEYENVIRAVSETSGVVGMYGGGYAQCFYTASNGGQIATPVQVWGGSGDYGYIEMKADPYDLENPMSMVNSFSVPIERDAANALWQMIDARLKVPGMPRAQAQAITGMQLFAAHDEGSLMYGKLEISLQVTSPVAPGCFADGVCTRAGEVGHKCGPEMYVPVPGGATVVLDVYTDIKDGLDIGLNGRDYEICSLRIAGGAYHIEMRRFGHGTGMSQRGAQTMAGTYGFGYDDILAFYYPGMSLEMIGWDAPGYDTMEPLPDALAREMLLIPPAEDWNGGLREGEYFAVVQLDSRRSRLNVRDIPSTEGSIVAKLDRGYRLAVMEVTEDGWAHVRAAGFSGYVKTDYITAE